MEPNPNNIAPLRSCLKRRPSEPNPPPPENDETTVNEELKYHFTDSSEDNDSSNSADELSSSFIHGVEGGPCADYRRAFSLDPAERQKWIHRKNKLGPFFPPRNPVVNDVKQRYDRGENFFKRMADRAWKDSASAQKEYTYEAMRKKINIDATRDKFNQKKPIQKQLKRRVYSPKKKRSSANPILTEDSFDHAFGDDTFNLQEEYLSNLPSTSRPRTTPAQLKNNLTKRTNHTSRETIQESPLKPERSEFS